MSEQSDNLRIVCQLLFKTSQISEYNMSKKYKSWKKDNVLDVDGHINNKVWYIIKLNIFKINE